MGRQAAKNEARGGAATDGGAPIDLAHLARQTFGSQALEREVLGLFVAQTPGLVAAIAASAGADRAALLHRLKGSARGIGAIRIAALAEALEADGLAPEAARATLAALAAAEEEMRRFVGRRLGASEVDRPGRSPIGGAP